MRKTDNATTAHAVPETSPVALVAAGVAPSDAATGATADTAAEVAHAADHPDRDLLDLVTEYHRLQAIEDQKSQIEKARMEAVKQLIPPAPEELTHR